ncbi:MAG: hypothetical protein KGI28_07725 [Thaumarchaeota archaeon]|nr:hypothetical protein [Nitrososphaerota archaeon]
MYEDQDKIHKVLISLTIEKALLDVGKLIYENVVNTLEKKYHCTIEDCYDHPQYLREILDSLDKAGDVILVSLKKDLDRFRNIDKIEEFLQCIGQ